MTIRLTRCLMSDPRPRTWWEVVKDRARRIDLATALIWILGLAVVAIWTAMWRVF